MKRNSITIAANHGADTRDIIFYLCQAIAPGIKQIDIKDFSFTGKGAYIDGLNVARWINNNIKYQRDGYENQNIQLPERLMYRTKKGDCKSFSLLFLAIMTKLGYPAGFRFASYRVNKIPTHVYNFIIDEKGNKHTFDTCLPTLQESNKATYVKDMQVNYLNGVPVMVEDQSEISGKFGKKVFSGVKKVGLSIPRQAFRSLIALNFRGLANKLEKANQKKLETIWKNLGGNFGDLKSAINSGKKKKPLFGSKSTTKKKGLSGVDNAIYLDEINEPEYIGLEPATMTLLTSAAAVLSAIQKFLQKEGIQVEETELPDFTPIDEGKGFVVTDPDPGVKVSETGSGATESKSTGGISPMLLIGGVIAIGGLIFLTTKKKR